MDIRESLIRQRLQRAIDEKVFPGACVGTIKHDGSRVIIPAGNFTYESQSPEVTAETQYDVASITKSIPTGSLALALVEEGKMNLDDKITKFLPEYKNNYSDQVLIRHLLTYSVVVDFADPNFSIQTATPEEVRHNLLTTDLKFPPGEIAQYTNAPALILTMVLEKITGTTLDELAKQYFFNPLQMNHSTFTPEDMLAVPPTEIDDWRGLVQGVVHDETSFVLGKERPSGCAGLFSNVPDLLTFLEMLLNEGELNGRRYFSKEMVQQMHTNQFQVPNACMGLGWELNEPRFMGKFTTSNTFGKTGFTGTVCVIHVEHGIAYVLLSNRTYPKRSSPEGINEVRRDISDIVFNNEYEG